MGGGDILHGHAEGLEDRDVTRRLPAGDAAGRVLNIATGSAETVEALADTIGRLLDRPVEKTYGPAQPGDVRESWADVSAAREAIGYEPLVGFEEGLRRTIDAMLGAETDRR